MSNVAYEDWSSAGMARGVLRIVGTAFTIILIVSTIGGCVSDSPKRSIRVINEPMAIRWGTTQIDLRDQGVALLPVRLIQKDFTGIPELTQVGVVAIGPDGKPKEPAYHFKAEQDYRREYSSRAKFRDYLVSMQLDPGDYRISFFDIATRSSQAVQAEGVVPVFGRFHVAPGKVTYLGSLTATMRKRKCGELKIVYFTQSSKKIDMASQFVPLLGAITEGATANGLGYSGGTFEFDVFNNIDHDVAVLRNENPVLKTVTIVPDTMLTIMGLSAEQIASGCAKEKQNEPSVGFYN